MDFSIGRAHGDADGSDAEVLCLAFVAAEAPLLASAGNDRVVRCWGFREHTCVVLATLEVRGDYMLYRSVDGYVSCHLMLLKSSVPSTVQTQGFCVSRHLFPTDASFFFRRPATTLPAACLPFRATKIQLRHWSRTGCSFSAGVVMGWSECGTSRASSTKVDVLQARS